MGVEPDELRYREFRRGVRGYSPDEVDDLLDDVADELDGLRAERDRLLEELERARGRIERYESLEGSIRTTLARAERAADDYQEAARREAEATIREAETRARRLFDGDFRRLLEGYLKLLDEADSATAREIEAPLDDRLDHEAIAAARSAAEEEHASPGEEHAHAEVRDDDRAPDPASDPPEGSEAGESHETVADTPEEGSTGRGEGAHRGGFLRRRG